MKNESVSLLAFPHSQKFVDGHRDAVLLELVCNLNSCGGSICGQIHGSLERLLHDLVKDSGIDFPVEDLVVILGGLLIVFLQGIITGGSGDWLNNSFRRDLCWASISWAFFSGSARHCGIRCAYLKCKLKKH